MNMFWVMRASGAGSGAYSEAARAKGSAQRARNEVADLESRLDRALLACEAMWTIVRDKLAVTDVELVERINDIDLSDGKLDGKVRKDAVSCPKCSRTVSRRFQRCMYCSQPLVHDPFA